VLRTETLQHPTQPGRLLAPEATLAEAMGKGEDYDAYLRRVRAGKVRPRAPSVFAIGEALRACGIGWSTGLGALWAGGYLSEYARALASLARDCGVLDMTPRVPVLIVLDPVVLLGMLAPLCASPSLALQLHADAEQLDKARHTLAVFARLPVAPRDEAAWSKGRRALPGDGLLVHAASLGDVQNIEIAIRERLVWMLVAEWAIDAASAQLREGRLAEIAGLWVSLGRLMETAAARDATVARAADLIKPPTLSRG
jgi:hypothetical protein